MNILIDARYLSNRYSGIATYSQGLIEHLSRLDETNQYTVIVHRRFRGALNVGENFEVISHPARPVSFRTLFTLDGACKNRKVDVFHSLFPLAPLRSPAPVLLTLHDLQPFWDPEFSGRRPGWVRVAYDTFYRWVYPATLRLARWIVVDSEATRQGVREIFPDLVEKLIVVPLGLDESATIPPPPKDVEKVRTRYRLDAPYFLYYGSTRPNKNLPRLVEAFARMRRLHPEQAQVQLLLVVQVDRFFLDAQAVIKRENLGTAVRVLEPVSNKDRKALLVGARAFCFPTRFEGFGLPILESQALGIPVLASTSAALPETGGEGAYYIDPDDTDSMAEGLWRLQSDEELRRGLIERGRANIRRFSWQDTAQQTLDIYKLLF
jgi:glycosyltransferase involved in cell wall biosynthesis